MIPSVELGRFMFWKKGNSTVEVVAVVQSKYPYIEAKHDFDEKEPSGRTNYDLSNAVALGLVQKDDKLFVKINRKGSGGHTTPIEAELFYGEAYPDPNNKPVDMKLVAMHTFYVLDKDGQKTYYDSLGGRLKEWRKIVESSNPVTT